MQVKQIASLNDILEYEISQPNELINDWDVCDWKFDYRNPRWRDNHTPEELSVCNKTCSEVQGMGWAQNTSLDYLV